MAMPLPSLPLKPLHRDGGKHMVAEMKITLIALFTLAVCLPLPAQEKPKPDTTKSNVEWQNEEMCQFVFFAVLEG
ncbi:MAG: hypothetical protein ACKVKM_11380, partial [Verrucomicrobiia bacterium]